METAQLLFRSHQLRNVGEAEDRLQEYLGALSHNGQILGDSPMARVRGGYLVVASLPRRDALDDRVASKWVRRALRKLLTAGLQKPRVRCLGPEPESRAPCECRGRPFLVLFTNCLSDESPVRCGACFGPIPLYTLPVVSEVGNYQDLLRWQSTYQAMDWLHIGSGAGERYGHEQMARHDSALSKEGRELARSLEKRARRPVYYYLMKHYGSSDKKERLRKCPSCKRAWLLRTPLHRIFDFRCSRCRLLSNVAFDVRQLSAV
jgi:predicted  nucleic acid-binding Zn ribbon protein